MKGLKPYILDTSVVIDGYPRTKVQVECLKLFYQKLAALRTKHLGTAKEARFHKPIFHIIVLYVDEAVSVNRQLQRGRMVQEHNRQVESTGTGHLRELRKTDLSVEAARNRYRTFKEITYESLTSLRQIFHYHFINAQQSIEESITIFESGSGSTPRLSRRIFAIRVNALRRSS